ncbi:hypothetical protein [Nocardioides sp. T2.26MG-1]|uniref:hypothetical protein n=1 Tax=Nocardioides sp. T2.26MG-1 TaxID=3041166 RepID=UPI00247755C2|nr:hypothetical protein [Nocardioides sp. T2.26MG-1]CAI9417296.1 hypothetical protein HIDPHFAB_02985 [Nocardioides sp. T2.26MG-1]
MTFYASPYGGRRYHGNPCCNGLNSTEMAQCMTGVPSITRADVVRRGLTPCRVCLPPPLLTAVPDPAQPVTSEDS